VVVVTHDGRYFHSANRVLKIAEGQMVDSQRLEKDMKGSESGAKGNNGWRAEIARNE